MGGGGGGGGGFGKSQVGYTGFLRKGVGFGKSQEGYIGFLRKSGTGSPPIRLKGKNLLPEGGGEQILSYKSSSLIRYGSMKCCPLGNTLITKKNLDLGMVVNCQ